MNNYTKEVFNFKELQVEKTVLEGGERYIYASCIVQTQLCPYCNQMAYKSKGYGRTRVIRDVEAFGSNTKIIYKPKRLRCSCGKTFTIKCVDIPTRSNITQRQKEKILADLSKRMSLKEIAKVNNVSSKTVARLLDSINYELDQIGDIVCIDDFKGNLDGVKFQTVMCNPVTGRITNIYCSRKKDDLIREISKIPRYKRNNVKFYICDMNETYISIGQSLFRNAKIIIDKFHYTKLFTEAFEKIRIAEQNNVSDNERKYFKHNRFILLKRKEKLVYNEKRNDFIKLDRMLNTSDKLFDAYNLLQEFYHFNDAREKEVARNRIKKFADHVEKSNIQEFKDALDSFRHHYDLIMNAFEVEYTNGFTEGKNNNIKSMKRLGFGYVKRDRFLKRMMHIENNKNR